MAGHSKWANIKHRKGRQDALRGKKNTKLIREITVAAKESGADPSANPRLRLAIEKANRANVTKDSIKKAIDKGSGHTAGDDFFEVIYEGYGPGGVAMMVTCLTDNKNRTVSEVRHAFNKAGGNLGTDGSVSYLFQRKAVISCEVQPGAENSFIERCMDWAVEDVEAAATGRVELIVGPTDFHTILESLRVAEVKVDQADLRWVAGQSMLLDQSTAEKLLHLEEVLEDLDDVQAVFHNGSLLDEDE